jgi:serine/threonine protein kinase
MDRIDLTDVPESPDTSPLEKTQALRTPAPVSHFESRDFSGTILGGYQLIRKMAEGGMGVVYEAVQLNLSRKVALKILNEELAARPEFVQRFEREAKAAAALNHPNVVQVYDFGETQGWRYLIMEFVEGQDLSEYTEAQGKLPVLAALDIIEQTAQGLKAACEKSIIHRDIKPSNLLLTRDSRVKVLDLGLAKILTEASDLTLSGVGMGSPYFMAPEQAHDARDVDHRADIYALGLTLLFLLTGKRPYDGNTPYSIVLAHANKPLPSGIELGTELPEEVEALVSRMAAKDRHARYADYNSLIADIQRVKAGYEPALKRLPARRSNVSHKWIWAAAGLALLLVIVAGAAVWLTLNRRATLARVNSAAPAAVIQPPEAFEPGPPDRLRDFPDERGLPPREGAFDERRGPPSRDREGRFPFPLPHMPRPDFASLNDGPVTSMLAEADQYAQKNPQNFRNIIDRYRQVLDKARGTAQAEAVNRKLDEVVGRHQAASRQAIGAYESKMNEKLRAGKPQEGYDLWKDFPTNLRTRESDQQIQQLLDRALPADFFPK